jgi:hypothetical protein
MSANSTNLTLPDYFPASIAACSKVSNEFFDCFSTKSIKSSDTDTEAGQRALNACQKELAAYKKCMTSSASPSVKGEKKFRVSLTLIFFLTTELTRFALRCNQNIERALSHNHPRKLLAFFFSCMFINFWCLYPIVYVSGLYSNY